MDLRGIGNIRGETFQPPEHTSFIIKECLEPTPPASRGHQESTQ